MKSNGDESSKEAGHGEVHVEGVRVGAKRDKRFARKRHKFYDRTVGPRVSQREVPANGGAAKNAHRRVPMCPLEDVWPNTSSSRYIPNEIN